MIYEGKNKNVGKQKHSIKLLGDKGYIRRRSRKAILRYYLPYENTEDFCRSLLILFFPFRDEMNEIHNKDVINLFEKNRDNIRKNRMLYDAYEIMTDTIKEVQKLYEDNDQNNDEDDDDQEDPDHHVFVETTAEEEISDFEKW